MDIWLGSYLKRNVSREPADPSKPVDIFFALCDHFEPRWEDPGLETERRRVDAWCERRPGLARGHRDSDGRPPQHTFFYPQEEYCKEHVEKLAALCRKGHGEVEVHLHHDRDTSQGFREKLERFRNELAGQGLLARAPDGAVRYAFIHGNWALDNSLPDGTLCGVNDELTILRETGCYADFTLPSAPSAAQTRTVNSIYYAADDPASPKSHDRGTQVKVGGAPSGDLLLIQGPLAFNWRRRKWGILPRIENGEIACGNPPTPQRVDLWVRQAIHVEGRPNWIFIKVHTHGAQEANWEVLLGRPLHDMLDDMESRYNDGRRYRLHYVTAREMYNVIKAAEAGLDGDPGAHRDFALKRGF
ncbi:MAG: hypothetical protein HYY14_05685 [Candidatus Omnitrophica bacterium]|nr:hypothetical protein [Candidatus Omnitrophota bacterium]